MGKKSAKLRDLIRELPSTDEEREFWRRSDAENPLTVAIVATAMIEAELEEGLQATIGCADAVWDRLVEDRGPLGTLSAKALMARALGLASDEAFRQLNVIRQIRNMFAHGRRVRTFEEPAIIGLLKSVKFSPSEATEDPKAFEAFIETYPQRSFAHLCILTSVLLYRSRLNRINHLLDIQILSATRRHEKLVADGAAAEEINQLEEFLRHLTAARADDIVGWHQRHPDTPRRTAVPGAPAVDKGQ